MKITYVTFIGLIIFCPFWLISIPTFIETGNTYYVATNGNDSNPGTEIQPWRTIMQAVNIAVAGDTVYVKEGTYKERITIINSGSPGNYINISAYPNHTVTINGTEICVPECEGLIEIRGKSYIKISGFRIVNSEWAGILTTEDYYGKKSSHIIIENNFIYNTYSSGILMQKGNNYTVDCNEIVLGNNAPDTARVEEIIAIQYDVDTFEVKNNYIHHSGYPKFGGEGIDAKWNASNGKIYNNHIHDIRSVGIYVDSWVGSWYWGDYSGLGHGYVRDIDVYNNRVYNTGGAGIAISAESGGNVDRINVYNNIVYNCQYSIMIPAYADPGSPVGFIKDVNVINNVFYNNRGGAKLGSWETYLDNIVLSNNIFSQNQWWQIKVKTAPYIQNIDVNHNLIDGFRGATDETKGYNYVESDPQFLNASGADFHLQSTSYAIDNGSSINAPSSDYDGNNRPKYNGYDIGAYEYDSYSYVIG